MLTLGIGIADSRSPPPRSSSMFLMSIDLSATARSAEVSVVSVRVRDEYVGGEPTNNDGHIVVGLEGDGRC
jgi:hypothetical protein